MLRDLSVAVFLVWATLGSRATGQPCLCSALAPSGLRVNCSSLNLVELPRGLPSDATELHAQDNRLTSVPPGLFDGLVGLKKVSLSGNPFHCDCGIQYLRSWLLRNRDVVSAEPTCAGPSAVARRAVADLGDDYFSSCGGCAGGAYDAAVAGMLCCLIGLLLWSVRLAKMSTVTLCIHERHSGIEAERLRSRRPKHRRRSAGSEVGGESVTCARDVEKTLGDMELLPQVLDTLHKKHCGKIKAI
ncbi:glycoprotein IX (platelet) [Pseudoliparis swirei]|uniref:glycoprotein IX (platelet) n=1 Tax=Pseudoliparis swirei TaxID=2059687 RepID=UPI0024BE656E|nr:glycoprotein IX (platelet) [Pseudoliparis swirei]XP_056278214.1 glycoprotein IX (platelet) [Pseudoliparis swirei]